MKSEKKRGNRCRNFDCGDKWPYGVGNLFRCILCNLLAGRLEI